MKMKCPNCGVNGSVSDSLLGKKVKCPKCNEIFRASSEEEDFFPLPGQGGDASVLKSGHESADQTLAEDEAALEDELAKIFEDMKNSGPEQNAGAGEVAHAPEPDAAADAETAAALETPKSDEAALLNDEELESAIEGLLGENCSVCGIAVEESGKHVHEGLAFCQACAPGKKTEGDLSAAPQEPVEVDAKAEPDSPAEQEGTVETVEKSEDDPAAAKEEAAKADGEKNPAGKIRLLVGGVAVVALILLAVYLITSK
ncbi:MAG: hypothetical protein P4L42_00975 [Desulfocapsaceae bacterium]|nr:hypothetical protein [Desulfocapsaceae bacterium]